MRRHLFYLSLICFLLTFTALTPQSVLAGGDPTPTPQPIEPPLITGQNTRVTTGSGVPSEVEPPAEVESPGLIGLAPQIPSGAAGELVQLAVPQRYQEPDDPTCGAAALGMALEFLSLTEGGSVPDTDTLTKDLDASGFLYDTGTGVEELAYLARAYGYRGASPFHGWTLEGLAGELAAGRPVVVSLGLNGQNQPGHFVTVTGMASDGSWVTYNDPVLGEVTVSAEEFLASWGAQGYSGLTVGKGALAAASDPLLPWMGLLGAMSVLSVLARYYPQGNNFKNLLSAIQGILGDSRRKGLGGKLEPVYEWKQIQVGTKVVTDTNKKIPEYGTRWVQDGWKTVTDYSKKIYEYGTRMVQQGWKTVKDYSKKIYEYGTRWVQNGWKTVKDTSRKIYEYGTRWVQKGMKKVTSWVKGIWGWFKKTKWVPKIVKEKFVKGWHYATKKVPRMVKETFVKGWHYATKKVPNMVKETFVKGWHYATKTVPKMVKETFVKGWHYATKVVPNYVWKKVQVGWKEAVEAVKDIAANSSSPATPTPTATPTPPPSVNIVPPKPVQTPEPEGTPVPNNIPLPEDIVLPNPVVNENKWENVEYAALDGERFITGEGDLLAIDPNDINQGEIGDCYLISALAEIALKEPELIADLISDNGDGTYTVNLYRHKYFNLFGELIPNPITITNELPTRGDDLVFARGADPDELWPMLIEKAVAAENGSYKGIEGGWGNQAMEQLTGVESEKYKPDRITFDQLDEFNQQGYAMTAATYHDLELKILNVTILDINNQPDNDPLFINNTLTANHVYYVVNVDSAEETITLANPWSPHEEVELTMEEFQGAFSRLSVNPLEP